MATKGPSNLYGNTRGANGKGKKSDHIGYRYAKAYNRSKLETDFKKHGKSFGVGSAKDYAKHAVKFANFVDRVNCRSYIDEAGSTHKYNFETNTYCVVDKRGYVVTYFKPTPGAKYYLNEERKYLK